MKNKVLVQIAIIFCFFMVGCGCEHDFDNGKITKEATCIEEGERTYTCKLCSETKVESVEIKPHQYDEIVIKEPTFEVEGEKIFVCKNCDESYKETIPVRDDEIVVAVIDKINEEKNSKLGRYSNRVNFIFDVTNRTEKTIKGVQGELKIFDLFDEEMLTIGCDFVGESIEPNKTIRVDTMGIEINEFLDAEAKLYNTDFSDLKFNYTLTNIVYDDGTSMKEEEKESEITKREVTVVVSNKKNLEINYNTGRYSPRVEFEIEVFNHTSKYIKGIQGNLIVKDLFGEEFLVGGLDITGKTIEPNGKVSISGMGRDINQFDDSDVKLYNTDYDDLQFEYEIQTIVYDEEKGNEAEEVENNSNQGEKDSNADSSSETVSMTMEEAATFLNGTWKNDAGGGYTITADALGNMTLDAGNVSVGTFSIGGNKILYKGSFSADGFNYVVNATVIIKGSNTASISVTLKNPDYPDLPEINNPAQIHTKIQ